MRERAINWGVGIGLQEVDDLSVSDFMIELVKLELDGKITHEELNRRLEQHYAKTPSRPAESTYTIIEDDK